MQMQMQAAGWGVTHRVQQLYLDLHAVQELLHVSRQGPGGPRPTAQDQDLRGGADELQEGQAVHRDLGQRAWPPTVHVISATRVTVAVPPAKRALSSVVLRDRAKMNPAPDVCGTDQVEQRSTGSPPMLRFAAKMPVAVLGRSATISSST